MKRHLSPSDRRILRAIQGDGRIPNSTLAEKVGLAASPCLRRLKALEEDGIIEGYRAMVNRKAVGFEVEAFVFIKLEQSEPGWRTRLVERLKGYEEVIACHALAGEVDIIVHAVARDIESFGEFTMNRLLTLPGVADVRSSFVLSTIKPPSPIPVSD
ncbi:Lrp/AsnC family transcriptional regulator [Microvirga guangxiensis]|uniref:Lrp/AsnC family transcriptional regulator, leucine-responsive regulatory protein n=1 Tax=Microvirga guangxiensis TaxID=549386 RepID=A0A1G5I2V4_9HYPH|nr:Lrp/AsnC family transcriptional regulator [Microvirga guangxiensis]SCY70373.1 Lrp/AsnC family transcriptional regulator, leucine-responsive regulatory protein [Microvirga guangxiensis]